METTLSFTVTGPITFVGSRDDLEYISIMRGGEVAIALGQVRKAHLQLSDVGADKVLLDTLARARLELERANRILRP